MKILRIGIAPYEKMKARTMAIARGELKPGPNEPKLWFTSIDSLARVLSDKNRLLLDLIIEQQPKSIADLENSIRPCQIQSITHAEKHGSLRPGRIAQRRGRHAAAARSL